MGPVLERHLANEQIRLLQHLDRWTTCRNIWPVGGIERNSFLLSSVLRAAFKPAYEF